MSVVDGPVLKADALHAGFRVARACSGAWRDDLVDAREVLPREPHVESADILLQVLATLGAGDRHDVVALRQHPGERELRGRAALLPCHGLDLAHEVEVLLEVLALEARRGTAEIVRLQIVDGLDLPGEEAAA